MSQCHNTALLVQYKNPIEIVVTLLYRYCIVTLLLCNLNAADISGEGGMVPLWQVLTTPCTVCLQACRHTVKYLTSLAPALSMRFCTGLPRTVCLEAWRICDTNNNLTEIAKQQCNKTTTLNGIVVPYCHVTKVGTNTES